MDSNVSVTVQLLFTAGSQCLFTERAVLTCSRFVHRALVDTKWALHMQRRTAGLVKAHIHDVFSAAVRWQRIRRSESRPPCGMTGSERRLAAPVISRVFVWCVVHIHRLLYRCKACRHASSPTVLRSSAANHLDGAEPPMRIRPPFNRGGW